MFAGVGTALIVQPPSLWTLVGTAVCVQLRLLCNLLDGMVAIEGGRKTATGGLYNELPDRFADSALIVALGYGAGEPWLGWLGALAAAVTAYIRVLGGTLGLAQDFRGPMAKPHRMAVLTFACIAQTIELAAYDTHRSLVVAGWIIAVGSIVTCGTRTIAIARALHAKDRA